MSDFQVDDDNVKPTKPSEGRSSRRSEESVSEQPRTAGFQLSQLSASQYRAGIGGISDAALQTLIRVFEGAKDHESPSLSEQIRRDQFKLLPLISHTNGTNPALLVTLSLGNDRIKQTLVYVIVIEQAGAIQTRSLTDQRESYESLILPEDQLNNRYYDRIRAQLADSANSVAVIGSQVILAETTQVLTQQNGDTDPYAKGVVASILNNAIDALSGYREKVLAATNGSVATPVSITPDSVGDGDRIEVVYDYPVMQEKDTSGLPIRQDIAANVYYSHATRDDLDNKVHDRIPLGSVTASMDLYLDDGDSDQRSRFGSAWSRRTQQDPFWQAVLDVTSVGGKSAVPYNLELAQLLLAQMAPQTNEYRWIRALRPRATAANQKGVLDSLVDLGWLNFYNPTAEEACYVGDIGPNVTDDALVDYLSQVIRPEISLGLTIPSSGDKSWVLSLFERIALTEGKERQKFVEMLYASANVLTGGKFMEYAEEAGITDTAYSPIITTGTRELNAVWTDNHGNLRSGSEWNVLAFATQVGDKKGAQDLVRDYQLTFETQRSGRSVDFNLSARWDMLRRFVCPTIRPVGTSEKLIIDLTYLEVLSKALSKTSLDPYITNADAMHRRQRAGNTAYRDHAGSNIGSNSRRRDEETGGRNRSIFRTGDRY